MRKQEYPSPADFALLPRAPKNSSPVPRLTSLYHDRERGDYGDPRYPGNCSGNIIRDLLRFFQPSLVFDPMAGSGTCGDVCTELGIACVSDDLHCGFDACDPKTVPDFVQFDFVWLHPPYWRMKLYTDDPRDLSRSATLDAFLEGYQRLIENCARVLVPGGKLAILMGDYSDHEWGFVPLVYHTKRLALAAGLKQCCTDIIRFSHGASSATKEYRSSFIPGLHDVCMVFEKPKDQNAAGPSEQDSSVDHRLLAVAKSFQAACEGRINALNNEIIAARPDADECELNDLQDQIDHWTALLRECETAINAQEQT
jgi:SAM-dependent methyltransferase